MRSRHASTAARSRPTSDTSASIRLSPAWSAGRVAVLFDAGPRGLNERAEPANVSAMPKAVAQPTFSGFDKNAMGFWHELAAEMSKEWFVANKERYEAQWVAPMTALLEDVGRRLAPAYRPLKLGAPKVLRIYRDVRFSKDKARS